MIGIIITILICLTLIAFIWGRETAQGCASWILSGLFCLIGFIVVMVVLGAMGVPFAAIDRFFQWIPFGIAIAVVGIILAAIFSSVTDARYVARRRREQESRAAQRAQVKQKTDENAQAMLRAERQRRAFAPRKLRAALDLGNIREAHDICHQCGDDWYCVAVEWGEHSGNLVSWMEISPPPADREYDEARFIRFSRAERDATLQKVVSVIEDAIGATGNGSEVRATCALLALAGFSNVLGGPEKVLGQAVRLMRRVIWDTTSSQARRVAALIALGVFGCEYHNEDATSPSGAAVEPLSVHLSDDDPEIRAAAVHAIGMRLGQRLFANQNGDVGVNESQPADMQQMIEEARRRDAAEARQYERAVAGQLLPLLANDPDERVRAAVASALAPVEENTVRAALRKQATASDETEIIRQAATDALNWKSRRVLSGPSGTGLKKIIDQLLANALAYLKDYQMRSGVRLLPAPARPTGQRSGQTGTSRGARGAVGVKKVGR